MMGIPAVLRTKMIITYIHYKYQATFNIYCHWKLCCFCLQSLARVRPGRVIDRGFKVKIFYGQESRIGESTTSEYGVNYQLLAAIY